MNQGTARIDYLLSERDRFSGHFTSYDYRTVNVGTLPYTGSSGNVTVRQVSSEYTHTFSPHLLNTLRFGYANTNTLITSDRTLDHSVVADFGLQNLHPEPTAYFPPNVSIAGFTGAGTAAYVPDGATDINRQLVEQMTYSVGRHSLKWGGDLRFLAYNDLGYATENGQYTFSPAFYSKVAFGDFLLGLPSQVYGDQLGGSSYSYHFDTNNNEYSFFFQDDIKVSPSLTVNAGLRYEYVQWPKEAHNQFSNWNFQKGALDLAGKDLPDRIADPDLKDFGPRLGVAYSPSWLKKTVIRSGGAIMYGNYRQWEVALLHFNPPFVYEGFLFNTPGTPTLTTSNLWPPAPSSPVGVDFRNYTVDYQAPGKVLPRTYEWNFNIQHELIANTLLEVGYVGNRSVDQPMRYDANQAAPDPDLSHPTPTQTRRPYQNVSFVSGNTWHAWADYNALNVRLERRYANGLTILGTYTYSKFLEIDPNNNWNVRNIYYIREDYGPGPENIPHIVNISVSIYRVEPLHSLCLASGSNG
jgi:hypothetical protein